MASKTTKKATRKAAKGARKAPAARKKAPAAKKKAPAAKKKVPAAKKKTSAPRKVAVAKRTSPAKKASAGRRRTATEVVADVLSAAGWKFNRSDENGWTTFTTPVDDGGPLDATVARVSEELQRVVLYVMFRESAREEVRGEVVAFITRANWGLGDGNFEMSLDTGELRFKVALDWSGVPLAPLLVRNIILDAMDATEVYEAALGTVLRGEANAGTAIEAAEGCLT